MMLKLVILLLLHWCYLAQAIEHVSDVLDQFVRLLM
jgi:hypothetical protein